MNRKSEMWKLFAAITRKDKETDRETKTWWTCIGVGFVNRDGSINIKMDFVPTRLNETTLQLRPPSKDEPEQGDETTAAAE